VTLDVPSGFLYRPEIISPVEEAELLPHVRAFDYTAIEMRGQVARRRSVHFGWLYGYESWRIEPGPPIPGALLPLRERAAALVSVEPESLVEALVTEYPVGAGIGWHRDAPQFGVVVGISLLGACRMRFQRGAAAARQTRAVVLEPRSAYAFVGEARWQWQHSIPAMRTPRYSITFRTLREGGAPRSDARPSPG
jgi:alkylated DNA repair protein (DNA oxidative demethylase)